MTSLVRSVSLIPSRVTPEPQTQWGGDTEPTRLHAIKDPELRAAVMRAHRGWARRYAPHLLREWQ